MAAAGDDWGRGDGLKGRKVMIEFSSPNTNKPLHLGHVRNNLLGASIHSLIKHYGHGGFFPEGNTARIASSVENLTALARPVLSTERLAMKLPHNWGYT
mgnify:CR=1 FL=1